MKTISNIATLAVHLAAGCLVLSGCSADSAHEGHEHHQHQSAAVLEPSIAQINARAAISGNDALPYYDSEEFTPVWRDPSSNDIDGFHAIPDFAFMNQNGNAVTSGTYEDTIYVATFFFSTCPGICSPINERLTKVQDAFLDDDEVRILSHTITPDIDTVEVLQSYSSERGIDSKTWDLVTADRDDLYQVAKTGYFASEDLGNPEALSDFKHTENLLLIDKNRRIRGIYNGLSRNAIENLIDDIHRLKKEQSQT